ncbi:hypothetical protein [Actinosynnema sp. NPDC020468]|uniref:hypothetical protein n=1 Tax=Actinosynnema sp. NPDC020468 TaxID=3154488 RepID=UPI0033FA4EEB
MIDIGKPARDAARGSRARRAVVGLAALAAVVTVVGTADAGPGTATPTTPVATSAPAPKSTVQAWPRTASVPTVPPTTPKPGVSTTPVVPFLYAPTWLPEGYVESERSSSAFGPGAGVKRLWTHPTGATVSFAVVKPTDPNFPRTGLYSGPDGMAEYFELDAEHVGVVGAWGPDETPTRKRIRESVRPSDGVFRAPAGVAGSEGTAVYGRDGAWNSVTTYTRPGHPERFYARLTTDFGFPPEAVPTTARGLPATVSYNRIHLELEPGRWLLVEAAWGLTTEELVALAEEIEIDPNPDLGWIGK